MRSKFGTILITFFSATLILFLGGVSDIAAQGKGHGGGGDKHGGGGQPQQQRQAQPQAQRQQPQMRQQAQRQMPQMQRQQPQMRQQAQRQMPQMQRPAPQQMQRQQMPQWNRQAQRQQQMPQMQRQMPQWNRQAQRQQQPTPQVQRQQMPQWNRQAQRQAQQQDRQARSQIDRNPQRQQQVNIDRGRWARAQQQVERQRPSVLRIPQNNGGNNGPSARLDNRQADFQQRGNGPSRFDRRADIQQGRGGALRSIDQQAGVQQAYDRRGGKWQDRAGRSNAGDFATQNGEVRGYRNDGGQWRDQSNQQGLWNRNSPVRENRGGGGFRDRFDYSHVDTSGFRDQERAWRNWSRSEGRSFNERDFQRNVYEYTQREAWRNDLLRSVVSLNSGYTNDYYYIPPPQYPAYYGVNYEPWNYNIGYTYYDPNYNTFYAQPYYMAYQPYDSYYSSYYYDDPYYIDDPYDDYMTYQIVNTNSVGGFVNRLLGGLLTYGYDQGYRDGLMARQSGYGYTEYYEDPFVYSYDQPSYQTTTYTTTTVAYQPYLYSDFEDRHSLSEGYSLGYEDAFYDRNAYDPYYGEQNINIVSLYVGTTYQIV